MKAYLPTAIALLAVIAITSSYGKLKAKPIFCDQQYALCTSAKCIPDPNDSSKAICSCDVLEGKSLGHASCKKRKPKTTKSGVRQVISTFSLAQFGRKQVMTCPSGSPWTDCLDQPCIVDPANPSQAICSCNIMRSGSSQTLGGNCDQGTCNTSYWSGASPESNAANINAFAKELGLKKSPERTCP